MTEKITFQTYIAKYGKCIVVKKSGFGSGRIRRRIIVISNSQFKRSCRASKAQTDRKGRHEKWAESVKAFHRNKQSPDGKIKFETASQKQIFQAWIRSGYPFVKHLMVKSKSTEYALVRIKSALKKYEAREIIEAFETGHRMFNSNWFKYPYLFKHHKMQLGDFIQYKNDDHRFFAKRLKDLPQSWLEECLKGEKYLRQRYSFDAVKATQNDPLEVFSKQLLKTFLEANSLRNFDPEDVKIRASAAKWAKMLYNFARLNNSNLPFLVEFMDNAINKFKTIRLENISFALSENFYKVKIPEALIKWNRSHYEMKTWNTKMSELTKTLPKKLSKKITTGASVFND